MHEGLAKGTVERTTLCRGGLGMLVAVLCGCAENKAETVIDSGVANDSGSAQYSGTARPMSDSFEGSGPLDSKWTVYNDLDDQVVQDSIRYEGSWCSTIERNQSNETLWFQGDQGEVTGQVLIRPFEFVVRNIRKVAACDDETFVPRNEFEFAGVLIHDARYSNVDYSFVVAGNRGGLCQNCLERKNTNDGQSAVNDDGQNSATNGAVDLRVRCGLDTDCIWESDVPGDSDN